PSPEAAGTCPVEEPCAPGTSAMAAAQVPARAGTEPARATGSPTATRSVPPAPGRRTRAGDRVVTAGEAGEQRPTPDGGDARPADAPPTRGRGGMPGRQGEG